MPHREPSPPWQAALNHLVSSTLDRTMRAVHTLERSTLLALLPTPAKLGELIVRSHGAPELETLYRLGGRPALERVVYHALSSIAPSPVRHYYEQGRVSTD